MESWRCAGVARIARAPEPARLVACPDSWIHQGTGSGSVRPGDTNDAGSVEADRACFDRMPPGGSDSGSASRFRCRFESARSHCLRRQLNLLKTGKDQSMKWITRLTLVVCLSAAAFAQPASPR